MKSLTTYALATLFCVPAMAQFGGMGGRGAGPVTQTRSIEVEILEMEQEADKAALAEALKLQARVGMTLEGPLQKNQSEEQAKVLRDFIAQKKEAISARDAELKKRLSAENPNTNTAATSRRPRIDREAAIEKSENAQVETQLLQAQIELLQPALTKAVEQLAAAENAARDDEKKSPKANEARKAYEKIKAQYVAYRKQLRLEQQEVGAMGGMGVGMGGVGGGFR